MSPSRSRLGFSYSVEAEPATKKRTPENVVGIARGQGACIATWLPCTFLTTKTLFLPRLSFGLPLCHTNEFYRTYFAKGFLML